MLDDNVTTVESAVSRAEAIPMLDLQGQYRQIREQVEDNLLILLMLIEPR